MNRSFLKLVFVLLIVGLLPFVSSLAIVSDLISQSVAVGLNPEVRDQLRRSADTSRQFFRAERLSNQLAADLIGADPRWQSCEQLPLGDDPAEHFQHVLESYLDLHPRLSLVGLYDEAGTRLVQLERREPREDHLSRQEWRTLESCIGPVNLVLTFQLAGRFEDEHISLGDTLATFRALEANREEIGSGMRKTYLYFGGAVAVLALLIGALLARQTTRRIARIAQAAGRVAAGDLHIQVDDASGDDIGALARKFNAMVDDLRESQQRVWYLQRVSAWQDIARRLAHEIKNPLTPILLSMQQLDRKYDELGGEPERFRPLLNDALEIVEEEVETLRSLVRDFSDFARLPKVTTTQTQVSLFVEDVLRTNPQLAQQASIQLSVARDAERATAAIDSVLMRRVLINIIENAIQAAPTDAEDPLNIELSVDLQGDEIVICIVDEGIGVTETNLDRLFDPYFTTKGEGTGLGLAIVKKIVLEHDGQVSLNNRTAGTGCVVTIRLPTVGLGGEATVRRD